MKFLLLVVLIATAMASCNKPKDDPRLSFNIVWSKTFGGSNADAANDIACDNAGNIFLLTSSFSNDGDMSGYANNFSNPTWVVKLNADGQKQWQKGVSGLWLGSFGKMALSPDGGLAVGGSPFGFGHCWVDKLDSSGNLQWQTNVNTNTNEVTGLLATPNGFMCNSVMFSPYGNDSEIDQLDRNGVVTSTAYGDAENYAFIALPGGGYFTAGGMNTVWHSSGWEGPRDAMVNILDASGRKTRSNTLKGSKDDGLGAALATSQGNILAGGTSTSSDGDVPSNRGGSDAWLVMLDGTGGVLWSKTYGGSGNEQVKAIVETADGNYLVAATTTSSDGEVHSNHGANDVWLFKVDKNGNFLVGQNLGGTGDDDVVGLVKDNQGAYLLIGTTTSNDGQVTGNHGSSDVWVVKFKEE